MKVAKDASRKICNEDEGMRAEENIYFFFAVGTLGQ